MTLKSACRNATRTVIIMESLRNAAFERGSCRRKYWFFDRVSDRRIRKKKTVGLLTTPVQLALQKSQGIAMSYESN